MGKTLLAATLILGAAPVARAANHSDDVAEMFRTLKNTATAEESSRTENRKYTMRIGKLKRQQGLDYNEETIDLFISWADEVGFCAEARHVDVAKARHYDFHNGEPRIGPCPDHRRARTNWRDQVFETLKNAATAEESYNTTGDGYTTEESDLRAEGWESESREIEFTIVMADETDFCLEAKHGRLLATARYSSRGTAIPEKGRCEA